MKKIAGINYKTNGQYTEYMMAAWFFGKGQIDAWTKEAKKAYTAKPERQPSGFGRTEPDS